MKIPENHLGVRLLLGGAREISIISEFPMKFYPFSTTRFYSWSLSKGRISLAQISTRELVPAHLSQGILWNHLCICQMVCVPLPKLLLS